MISSPYMLCVLCRLTLWRYQIFWSASALLSLYIQLGYKYAWEFRTFPSEFFQTWLKDNVKSNRNFLFFPAPRFDPDVKKIELSYHEVTLYWDPYPTDEIHPGFLRGYHVYVSPVQEGCNLKGSKKHVLEGKILKFMRIMRLILQPLGKVILGQQIDPLRMA